MIHRIKRNRALPVIAATAMTSGCATIGDDDHFIDYTTDTVIYEDVLAEPAIGAALSGYGDNLRMGLYAGAGLGLSYLTPDTSNAPLYNLDDAAGGGGQITLGLDVNKHFSLEMHSADLGSAGLSPTGRINYHLNGASALYYLGRNRHNSGRRGFSAFGRLGIGAMGNSSIGAVSYTRTNDTHILFGAGLEYNTRIGLGARAELISFDKDAQYAQFGLLYRIGQRRERLPELPGVVQAPVVPAQIVVPPPEPVAAPAPKPLAIVAAVAKDTDRDGVFDRSDKCPGTAVRATVDRNGCAVFSGTIEGVVFKTASADLTDSAVDILDDVNRTLALYPQTHLLIKAHTDSDGESDRNQRLSERRARTVADFLAKRGIPYERITAKAYGERTPIDTNATAAGRANNRRVEIFAVNPR